MIRAIVFDADDTLWHTEALYDYALDRAQELMEEVGVDGHEWRRLQRAIDLEAVDRLGYSAERFPTSSVKAYRKLVHTIDADIEQQLYSISASVFVNEAVLVPDAKSTLANLQKEYRLAAVTKGDMPVQHRRMNASGLRNYFEVFAIVEDKRPSTFAGICELMSLNPGSVASVGNSVRSDLLPALQAGLHAVWIDAHVWAHESNSSVNIPKEVWTARRLRELPNLLRSISVGLE